MERSWIYKVALYLGITLVSAIVLVPSVATWFGKDEALPAFFQKNITRKISLGLDLQGGLHLVYEVQVDKAISDKADRLASEIEEKLRKDRKVTNVGVVRTGKGVDSELIISFKDPGDMKKVDREFLRSVRNDLYEDARDQSKGEIRLKLNQDQIDELRDYAVRQGVETIRNRVDKLAVAEPTIIRKGTDIVVELPGLKPADFERVKNLIGRTAQLEFKIVDDGATYMTKVASLARDKKAQYPGLEIGNGDWSERDAGTPHTDLFLKAKDKAVLEKFFADLSPEDQVPGDHEIGYEQIAASSDDVGTGETRDKVWRTYYLHRRAELTGEYLTDAEVQWDTQTGRPEVGITFDRRGADLFEKVSGQNIGRKMAIILDEKVTSAPVIESKIGGGRARITLGGLGDPLLLQEEAKDLVAVLRTGALPAPLKKTFETQVGPTLGRDQVDKAKLSMAIGSIAVILFMLIYYRMSGLIANLAMVLNILYLLAILAGLQATLTLPGIAGVVLTVGMAVDANIIIYERIREELRAGKSARGAVEAGFNKAFWTVFDAHVTNLVAGIVLYTYGTGPIRGFAVTLMAGIVCNLFTSVWLSRAMFDVIVGRKKGAALSI
ncbi:MAG TPA: protein translocase subunit SecD [Polyangia bacterium]|jgi:preprotein translocase subunit SecD|nr:protein translocase subunit SecD [Polyangia bacterium]